jgi:hypothetical protein
MALPKAAVMKIDFVLEIARKDDRFLNDLSVDPARTLLQSGIDLSHGEAMAIIDIIKNTSISVLAPHIEKCRATWKAILKERHLKN